MALELTENRKTDPRSRRVFLPVCLLVVLAAGIALSEDRPPEAGEIQGAGVPLLSVAAWMERALAADAATRAAAWQEMGGFDATAIPELAESLSSADPAKAHAAQTALEHVVMRQAPALRAELTDALFAALERSGRGDPVETAPAESDWPGPDDVEEEGGDNTLETPEDDASEP
ncbi:MAG: hypothetical protein HYV26_13710, partial [Candidatus Hydrogenedentes bacterium]|nr:hypothetical protein [Candidatus Hydrogenedentota bacterium]